MEHARSLTRTHDLLGLGGWLALCYLAAAVGSLATTTGVGTWYQTLDRPPWTPPDWVFGPVWTLLYGLMAVAAWLVWRRRGFRGATVALGLFLVQLALNVAWSFIFFGMHAVIWAAVEIVVLALAIVATVIAFWRISRPASLLLAPYLAWVLFAAALNLAIARMN
ncbi:MAG: TspO/MBR family protein [Phycisphaeraceae bacterium]